jgi:hypothetical protein
MRAPTVSRQQQREPLRAASGRGAGALTRRGGLARAPECARPRRGTPPAARFLRRHTRNGRHGRPSAGRTLRPASSERGTTRGDGVPTVKRGHCGEVQRNHRLHGRQRARHRRDRTRPARLRVARLRRAALEPADGSGCRRIWFIRSGCGNSHGRFPVGVCMTFDSWEARRRLGGGRGSHPPAAAWQRQLGLHAAPLSVLPVTRSLVRGKGLAGRHRARPA